jgi:hypothetical protein
LQILLWKAEIPLEGRQSDDSDRYAEHIDELRDAEQG